MTTNFSHSRSLRHYSLHVEGLQPLYFSLSVRSHLHDPNSIYVPRISHFPVNVLGSHGCFPPCPWLWIEAAVFLPCSTLHVLKDAGETCASTKSSVEQTLLITCTVPGCPDSALFLLYIADLESSPLSSNHASPSAHTFACYFKRKQEVIR